MAVSNTAAKQIIFKSLFFIAGLRYNEKKDL